MDALGKRHIPGSSVTHLNVATGDSSDGVSDNGYASSAGDDGESSGSGVVSELPPSTSDSPPLESTIIEKAINEPTSGLLYPSLYPASVVGPAALRRFAERLAFWNRKRLTQPPDVPNDALSMRSHPQSLKTNPIGVLAPSPPHEVAPLPPIPPPTQSLSAESVSSKEMEHTELEPKILRETIRIFSRDMYLAYDFGPSWRF